MKEEGENVRKVIPTDRNLASRTISEEKVKKWKRKVKVEIWDKAKVENWEKVKAANWEKEKVANWEKVKLENWEKVKVENLEKVKVENWETVKVENWEKKQRIENVELLSSGYPCIGRSIPGCNHYHDDNCLSNKG